MTRGRGRPVLFHADARTAYLKARTEGANQKEAAALVGVAAKTVRDARRADGEFRAADDAAAAEGKPKRLGHGESRYNHGRCRCPICTKAASDARDRRRHGAEHGSGEEGGEAHVADVVAIARADGGSSEVFPLARAS